METNESWFAYNDTYLAQFNLTLFDGPRLSSKDLEDIILGPDNQVSIVVYVLIGIVGIVGNSAVVRIVLTNRLMRNVPNILITSLALGDILLLVVNIPIKIRENVTVSWTLGAFVCKFSVMMQIVSMSVTILTLVALSADRFQAIMCPMNIHASNLMTRTYAWAIGIWVISFLLAIPDAINTETGPYLYGIGNDTLPVKGHMVYVNYQVVPLTYCSPFPRSSQRDNLYPMLYFVVRFVLLFIFPLAIIGTFYSVIAQHLFMSSTTLPGEARATKSDHKQLKARKRVAKTVLVFVAMFVVCVLPDHIYQLMMWSDNLPISGSYYAVFTMAFRYISIYLLYISSCSNPIVLYFLSNNFKQYFNRYLFCCRRPRKKPIRNFDSESTMRGVTTSLSTRTIVDAV